MEPQESTPLVQKKRNNLAWRKILIHAARSAVAAIVSLWIAQLFKLPEGYWACITTLIVMQSSLGESWSGSWQRLVGTALGAAMGALLTPYFGSNAVAFGIGVFALGLICALFRINDAYRLASITLAIVILIRRPQPAWIIAGHRFIEVALGIAVALLAVGSLAREAGHRDCGQSVTCPSRLVKRLCA